MSKKIYKYNIETNKDNVIVEIYYESNLYYSRFNTEISACSKKFGRSIWHFASSPLPQQLIDAKKWAEKQIKIMNENQPDE